MAGWTCPSCRRRFARPRQSHECAPAMPLEEYFSTGPRHERPVYEAVMAHLSTLGPVHVEPVSVGIFLKGDRPFAELRPLRHWVALMFLLPRPVRHPRITRKVVPTSGRYLHVFNLRGPEDLDDELRSLLTEAYLDSVGPVRPGRRRGRDPAAPAPRPDGGSPHG